jgi:hypothetical protein
MTALSIVVPDLAELVLGAAGQVFGMMLDADVATIEPQATVVAAASAHVDLTLEDRFVIRLGVHMGVVAATAVAARLTRADPAKVATRIAQTVAGEVSNLLMARLHASFSERSLKSEVSTPTLAGGGQVARPWTARAAHRSRDLRRRRVLRVASGAQPDAGRDAGHPSSGRNRRVDLRAFFMPAGRVLC